MVEKPVVLLIESTVQQIDQARRQALAQKVSFLTYDCVSVDEFIARLQPGGPYNKITAIVRTGWLKAGPYAAHQTFASRVIPHLPPSLKLICCSGHGYDAADIPALTARGIWYCNTPNACTEAVANTGIALVLETFRYLSFAQWCARYDWPKSRELGLKAVDPAGKVLGMIGMGDIGLAIAQKCEAALGMQIVYHGPRRKRQEEAQLKSGARYYSDLIEMLSASDCVVVAAPYTPETHHLLSHREFQAAKKTGLRVVNIARGKIIDEDALVLALEAGQVVGIGLDVHANEPKVHENLRENWMVTLLPHIAVCSKTSWANFERQTWDNLEGFLRDGKPEKPVNQC
ncbi:D-isomer specific 2-hydroxyacid dehydrogenase [Penicillium macrosclerotiorum]|uniref:D-isomer specific 2-hydroxyacid dehydrogenase n=1 Tax=Penicillium macrosclerotiorum TaxID=303699 RepID=UPI002547546E|nr:D-isomer specific 2-hydroxyacid dehydrogenase [Penicillium macrosclerotiorum]KAJ5682215.1 D-isomer specific 2-hydroxyacid dehydrogenase [Penicillium macrosclerotiorum]